VTKIVHFSTICYHIPLQNPILSCVNFASTSQVHMSISLLLLKDVKIGHLDQQLKGRTHTHTHTARTAWWSHKLTFNLKEWKQYGNYCSAILWYHKLTKQKNVFPMKSSAWKRSARSVVICSVMLIISPWKRENNYRNACIIQSREYHQHVVSQRESAWTSGFTVCNTQQTNSRSGTPTHRHVKQPTWPNSIRASQSISTQQGLVHMDHPRATRERTSCCDSRPLNEVHELNRQ
jgi:hypothetical protein